MADNLFGNSNKDFEDIFSNSSSADQYEDVYSNSADQNKYEDISSNSSGNSAPKSYDDYFQEDFTVKYNSAVQNRRRQEYSYDDVNEVYETISSANDEPKRKKKKRHPIRNTIIVLLCLIIVGVSCVGFYGYQTVEKLLSSFNTDEPLKENAYISQSELYSDPNQTNILLIGIDARKNDDDADSRSDTMMLVTIDNINGQIKLTSFLRDSFVHIAGKNWSEKLNAAYFRGGVQMLSDTLEYNFKVDIQYYMLVNFEIFTTIVDKLGGINVDVTQRESDYVATSKKPNIPVEIPAGEGVLLNGEQALWYARIRKLDSDFMRTKRQRKVISAMVDKALTKDFSELLALAEAVIPLVKTNLTSDQFMDLGLGALKNKAYSYDIVSHQVPADGTWSSRNITNVGSSLVMDIDENVELLHSFLKEKQEVERKEQSTAKAE